MVAVRAAGSAICVATKLETAATCAGENWRKAGIEMPPRRTMPATRLGNASACWLGPMSPWPWSPWQPEQLAA